MKTVINKHNVNNLSQPMFLGEPLGIQRYDNFKYPKFFELFRKQEEFHWMPEEVHLQKDRVDYQNLSETERFVFDSNLKFQTMGDSMLSRSIHSISKYVSNCELEICMNTWARFEGIHSYSYTYVLKNVYTDPTAFFDSILNTPEIVARAKELSNAYDSLLGETKDIKQKIWEAVVSTNITEGISFYISFACSFFFASKGIMAGNGSIIKLIHRDENLHVAITQNILKYFRENKEEGFQDIMKENEQKLIDMFAIAAENEKKWSKYLFSNGSLIGLNENVLEGFIEWQTNSRLVSLGYKPIFDQKNNPISGWYDKYLDSSAVQVAPQEAEITSYKIGAVVSNITDGEFDDIPL